MYINFGDIDTNDLALDVPTLRTPKIPYLLNFSLLHYCIANEWSMTDHDFRHHLESVRLFRALVVCGKGDHPTFGPTKSKKKIYFHKFLKSSVMPASPK